MERKFKWTVGSRTSVLNLTFTFPKLVPLKLKKYALNLKWSLTKWSSFWQPDYFNKLTASYFRLSQFKYTYQDSTNQRSGPTHSCKISCALCSMFFLLIPPSSITTHLCLHKCSPRSWSSPSPSLSWKGKTGINLSASYHQSVTVQGLESTES